MYVKDAKKLSIINFFFLKHFLIVNIKPWINIFPLCHVQETYFCKKKKKKSIYILFNKKAAFHINNLIKMPYILINS